MDDWYDSAKLNIESVHTGSHILAASLKGNKDFIVEVIDGLNSPIVKLFSSAQFDPAKLLSIA